MSTRPYEPSRSIVVILCDQLRPDFLTCYGGAGVPTPNIDRLAEMGVVFDNAITQSTVCAPARATMMTGRYVSNHGVWTNDVPFRSGLDYLPERMNQLGYRTGAFGKLHHYPADEAKGFSVAYQMEEGRLGDEEPYLKWLKKRHPEVTGVWNIVDDHFAFDEEEYHERWIADRAIEFIDGTPAEDPLLAWVSFQGPHTPYAPPREVEGSCDALSTRVPLPLSEEAERRLPGAVRYRRAAGMMPSESAETMNNRMRYRELIVEIDRQIGRLQQCLEVGGRLERTTIIFSADHGDLLGDFDLKAKGPYPYAGQMNIPLILANHPDIEPGTRSEALVGNIDIPGTCLAIAGDDEPIGHSISLLDHLHTGQHASMAEQGGATTVADSAEIADDVPVAAARSRGLRDFIFSEFCDSVKTVDDGRYRLSYYPFEGARLLFDREVDPDCTRDLSGSPEHAETELRLMSAIVDSLVVARGVRIEAHDLVPAVQSGLSRIDPHYLREFPVAFPLSAAERRALKNFGLDIRYNEPFRNRPVYRTYAPPYWDESAH